MGKKVLMILRKKRKQKGFTLIEILGVIVILGLVLAIAIPAVNKHLADVRIEYYKDLESSVLSAGKDYVAEKRLSKPTKLLHANIIKLSDLEKGAYIGDVKDYLGNKCDSSSTKYSYIVVVKTGDKKYDYQVCLRCSNDEYVTDTSNSKNDYCNSAWLTNDNLEYKDPGESNEVLYVQYGTSEEEIKPQVGLSYSVVKKDSDGNILKEAVDETSQKIYPKNINELVSANVNKKITLKYSIPNGNEITRTAIIYQHLEPKVKATYINPNSETGKAAGSTYDGLKYDEWANGVKFELSLNPNESDLVKNNIGVKNYEYYVEGSNSWSSFDGSTNIMSITNNYKKKIKFRFKNVKDQYSQETRYYYVSVDVISPICSINGFSTKVEFGQKSDNLSGIKSFGMNIGSSANVNYNSVSSMNLSLGTAYGYVRDGAGNTSSCSLGIYKLSYDVNGGSSVSPAYILLPSDVQYGTLPISSKNGSSFDGWTTIKDGNSYVTSAFRMGSQNVTIYAHFTTCAAGKYSSNGKCESCPSFYPNSSVGSNGISSCYRNVSAKKYIATAGATSESSCGKGTYKASHVVYYGRTSSCTNCPDGYRDGNVTTAQNLCVMNVDAGKYAGTARSKIQTGCGKGTYRVAHTVTYGNTSSCTTCPDGYRDGNGTTAQNLCVMNVDAGKYAGTARSKIQTGCGKGTYRVAHNVTYGNTSSCSACPDGYKDGNGTTAKSNCSKRVAANYYVGTAYGGSSACGTGYLSAAHSVNYGGTSSCTAKSVTVTFNKNDGSGSTVSQSFIYGASGNKFGYNTNGTAKWGTSGQFGAWTRAGYNLLGWSTSSSASSATYSIYSGVSNDWINSNYPSVTLYAVWVKACSSISMTHNVYTGNNGGSCWSNDCTGAKHCQNAKIQFNLGGCTDGLSGHMCYYNPSGTGESCWYSKATYPVNKFEINNTGGACFTTSKWYYYRSTEYGYAYACNSAGQCTSHVVCTGNSC